jgi:hypothetical protein
VGVPTTFAEATKQEIWLSVPQSVNRVGQAHGVAVDLASGRDVEVLE